MVYIAQASDHDEGYIGGVWEEQEAAERAIVAFNEVCYMGSGCWEVVEFPINPPVPVLTPVYRACLERPTGKISTSVYVTIEPERYPTVVRCRGLKQPDEVVSCSITSTALAIELARRESAAWPYEPYPVVAGLGGTTVDSAVEAIKKHFVRTCLSAEEAVEKSSKSDERLMRATMDDRS